MKNKSKFFLKILGLPVLLNLVPVLVFAQGVILDNPLRAESFEELIGNVLNFLVWVGFAVAPLMIIIAGFLFVTSGGDPAKITKAKNIMLYTAIGLAIILFSWGFVAVIQRVLGG